MTATYITGRVQPLANLLCRTLDVGPVKAIHLVDAGSEDVVLAVFRPGLGEGLDLDVGDLAPEPLVLVADHAEFLEVEIQGSFDVEGEQAVVVETADREQLGVGGAETDRILFAGRKLDAAGRLVATLINREATFEEGIRHAQDAIDGSCSMLLLTDRVTEVSAVACQLSEAPPAHPSVSGKSGSL